MESNFDKLKIELETTSEIAFLLAIIAHQGLKEEVTLTKLLSAEAISEINALAQNIMDQVGQKTNFKYKFGDN
jgi:hypothetical protein